MRILKLKRDEKKAGESNSRAARSVFPVLELRCWGSCTSHLTQMDGQPQQSETKGCSRAREEQLLLKA